jgi:hypothetical protein
MKKEEMKKLCKQFFEELSEKLKNTHVVVRSCNQDESAYLVPIGTEDQITYHGKPDYSFRISDHWNWYSNVKKNPDPYYVQCENVDLMPARMREAIGRASIPIWAWTVAYYGPDCKYHTMIGEFFNTEKGKWDWVDCNLEDFDEWINALKAKVTVKQ